MQSPNKITQWTVQYENCFFAAHLTSINEYLPILPGLETPKKFVKYETNETILHYMLNSWANQAHLHWFYFRAKNWQEAINLLKKTDMSECIFEVFV